MPLGMSNYELANLGIGAAAGAFGGAAKSGQNKLSKQQQAQQQLNDIRQQRMLFQQGKLDRGRQDQRDFLSGMGPLGQEQGFVQRNNIIRSILPQLASMQSARPLDPAIAAVTPQIRNPLAGLLGGGPSGGLRPDIAQAFSDDATQRALTDRRKALAGLNPDFQFQPLTDYMGNVPNIDSFHGETVDAGRLVRGQRDEGYNSIEQILGQMETDAQKQAQEAEKKGSPWWKKALQIGGGIGLAALTGGMSIPVQLAIQGAAGAGMGALGGGGVKGALLGAGMGAGSVGLGAGLGKLGVPGFGGGKPGIGATAGTNNQMTSASLPLGSGLPGGTGALGGAMSTSASQIPNNLLQLLGSPTGGIGGPLNAGGIYNPQDTQGRGMPSGAPRMPQGFRPTGGPQPGPQRPLGPMQGPPSPNPMPGGGGAGASMSANRNPDTIFNSPRMLGETLYNSAPIQAILNQPFTRAMGSPQAGVAMMGGGAGFGLGQGKLASQLTNRLGQIGGDVTPSGRMAVDQIQEQLMAIFKARPDLAAKFLGR